MKNRTVTLFPGLAILICFSVALSAQEISPEKNAYKLRGKSVPITLFAASAPTKDTAGEVLYMPGDGGLRGFSITICRTMSEWGYDVYALDTKAYLSGFTEGKVVLKPEEVMGDLGEIGGWIQKDKTRRVSLVGWSEGAGLCLLGAADSSNKDIFCGLITIGLDDKPVLGWRLADDITWLTKTNPHEPVFDSFQYMHKVAPLPLWMIQSSEDVYVSPETAQELFEAAREPKRFNLIQAKNHRYDGNHEDFFKTLREGLTWIRMKTQ